MTLHKTILTVRDGQCRFPVTDALPHLFCGEVTALDRVYCDEHHAVCNNGFGKDPRALEEMMHGIENTVVRRRPADAESPNTVAVDVAVRG